MTRTSYTCLPCLHIRSSFPCDICIIYCLVFVCRCLKCSWYNYESSLPAPRRHKSRNPRSTNIGCWFQKKNSKNSKLLPTFPSFLVNSCILSRLAAQIGLFQTISFPGVDLFLRPSTGLQNRDQSYLTPKKFTQTQC